MLLESLREAKETSLWRTSAGFFHKVQYELPDGVCKHLIERLTKKGVYKKIHDAVLREQEKQRIYSDFMRTSEFRYLSKRGRQTI